MNKDEASEFRSGVTEGVSVLSGDPRKAVIKLSGPMIAAMLLFAVYNLVDAIWVAGLGEDALAAVGFITPVFMILVGIGNGLGAGVTSAVSRRIGAEDKPGADSTSLHGILISVVISLIMTLPLFLLVEPLVIIMGAGSAAGLAAEYGRIVFLGTIFILFTNVGYAILRAEGDTKRTMYAMGASAVINMILDPILIYSAGMGIGGAAWATVISVAAVSAVLMYWLIIRKDTYVSISMAGISPDRAVMGDIFRVGLPAGLEFLLMSVVVFIINAILVMVSGVDAVAVYTAGWRVVMFAIIPMIAIGTATVAVSGALFGGRRYNELPVLHNFSTGIGIAIAIGISLITWVFAPEITLIYTYSDESAHLAPAIVAFLQTMCFFYPFVSPGVMSSSLFQGTGRGLDSLIMSLLRNLVFIAVFAYLLAIVLGWGESGVWWGIVAGNILGGLVSYTWARLYVSRLIRCRESRQEPAPE